MVLYLPGTPSRPASPLRITAGGGTFYPTLSQSESIGPIFKRGPITRRTTYRSDAASGFYLAWLTYHCLSL